MYCVYKFGKGEDHFKYEVIEQYSLSIYTPISKEQK